MAFSFLITFNATGSQSLDPDSIRLIAEYCGSPLPEIDVEEKGYPDGVIREDATLLVINPERPKHCTLEVMVDNKTVKRSYFAKPMKRFSWYFSYGWNEKDKWHEVGTCGCHKIFFIDYSSSRYSSLKSSDILTSPEHFNKIKQRAGNLLGPNTFLFMNGGSRTMDGVTTTFCTKKKDNGSLGITLKNDTTQLCSAIDKATTRPRDYTAHKFFGSVVALGLSAKIWSSYGKAV